MEISEYIDFVESEGKAFAAAADAGNMDVDISACEGWAMRELVRHLGMIHLWAAANVAFPQDDWLDVDELPDLVQYWPDLTGPTAEYPADDQLVDWYRDTLANLVKVLQTAPADHECFSFLPAPNPVTMWSRRQASEIAIHRFDAESARGISSVFDSAFAADMLDELLSGFAPRPRGIDIAATRVLHVAAEDVDEHWHLTIGPDGIATARDGGEADLTVRGTAAALYLLFWNRTPDETVQMDGAADLMDVWRSTCRVRWG